MEDGEERDPIENEEGKGREGKGREATTVCYLKTEWNESGSDGCIS